MAALKTRKDALGKPLDRTALYEPISSHARGNKVFNQGITVLRGDDPDVIASPRLWVREDATTPEKRAARMEHVASRRADLPAQPPDPHATRILGPIPQERRRVALRNYHDKAGRIVNAGSIWDANDDFVRLNPDLFGPEPA